MEHRIIISGFGGQGVMLLGKIISLAGMLEGKHVTWFPSYGPEMRGGTANCTVVISNDPIGSPVVDAPNELIVMNIPSLLKFEKKVTKNGIIFINSSVVEKEPERNDIDIVEIPANDIADKLGNSRIANMVMLGAYISRTNAIKFESVIEALRKSLKGKSEELFNLNEKAIKEGMKYLNSHIHA
ncbi:MAG: 2-oxoglutarate ferredoxin oxidoreductase subunit gamma [Thermotogaceae bacterium]|jgi:2-oxoglutarate ferredoxin oxidoreductase subunit gamma|nr:2-oxoglutarate ferredoxin oxidoreductase subunit gamma [Thermotogaceae bacterium]MDN5337693.1 2-oxoglutarate ferredoxin oxidoreductase subunit gamma [Thermotogaceae bacterium]